MEKIYITGSIDEESFQRFSETMDELEGTDNLHGDDRVDRVNIVLNSTGGSAVDALAFYERIKGSRLYVIVTVYGACYSAAVLILAAGSRRLMTKTAWLMVHEDSFALDAGDSRSTTQIEIEAEYMRRMENQWNYLLSLNSGISVDEWEYMHKVTTYMNAKECLEIGIIEEII